MIKLLKISECVMICGAIVGSALLAMNTDYSKYGYIMFMASSLSGMYVAREHSVQSMFLLQSIFTVVNAIGICCWLL